VLGSSFTGGHNQGLPVGSWTHRVPGSLERLSSLITVLPLGLDLDSTLVRVSVDFSSAMCPAVGLACLKGYIQRSPSTIGLLVS
jgi:hypothetical protein